MAAIITEQAQAPSYDVAKAALISIEVYSVVIPIAGFLTGLVVSMYLSYIRGTREEPALHKITATVVTVANIVELGLGIASLRHYARSSVDNPAGTLGYLEINVAHAAATLVTVMMAQVYYSSMVYKVTEANPFLLAVLGLLVISTLGSGIGALHSVAYMAEDGIPCPDSPKGRLLLLMYCWWTGSMTTFDLLVSAVLCAVFFSRRSKATFGIMSSILTYLLVTTLQTFALTAIAAVATLVLTVLPLWTIGLSQWRVRVGTAAIIIILGRVNAISLLYTLNRRAPLRARLHHSLERSQSRTATTPRLDDTALEGGSKSQTPSVDIHIRMDILSVLDEVDIGSCNKKEVGPTCSGEQVKLPTYSVHDLERHGAKRDT